MSHFRGFQFFKRDNHWWNKWVLSPMPAAPRTSLPVPQHHHFLLIKCTQQMGHSPTQLNWNLSKLTHPNTSPALPSMHPLPSHRREPPGLIGHIQTVSYRIFMKPTLLIVLNCVKKKHCRWLRGHNVGVVVDYADIRFSNFAIK